MSEHEDARRRVQECLLELLRMLDKAPDVVWRNRCTCGWESDECDSEITASFAGWEHAYKDHPDE